MKYLVIAFISSILSCSVYATGTNLFNDRYLPTDVKIEVTLNKVELAPLLNDYNMFFLGDNDFEMMIVLNSFTTLVEFPLKANSEKKKKQKKLSLRFNVDTSDLNYAIQTRRNYENLSYDEKKYISRSKLGQLCLLDDSLMSPGFISTSYYGCFDLAYTLQEMIVKNLKSKNQFVSHNTTFPASTDPSKEKLFKSWYTIRILKH